MKCPICFNSTLKEDYSKMCKDGIDEDGDMLYCPSCGFNESRAKLVKECDICQEIKRAVIGGLKAIDYKIEVMNIEETEEIKKMLRVLGFNSFRHFVTGNIHEDTDKKN